MHDLVIRNGKMIVKGKLVSGEIAIDDGIIRRIAVSGVEKGDVEINAHGRYILPGAIDVHAHIFDRRFQHRESFDSGTMAAAAGGVTTVIIMPLDTPVLTVSEVKKLIELGEKNSLIDFAIHAGNMTAEAIREVKKLVSVGVASFKTFTCSPYLLEKGEIERLMDEIKKANGILFVHAEDEDELRRGLERVRGRKDPLAHHEARTVRAEVKAVKEVIRMSRYHRCKTHFAHITSAEACEVIKKGKRKIITAETCTHYLIFTREDVKTHGPYLRVNPSIKTKKDRAALWRALSEGTLDLVATDHAPGTVDEKEVGWDDIWKAQIGIPGVENLLPLMLEEGVCKKRISLRRLIECLSIAPAKIFGLYPRKGALLEGSDADLVIVDLKKKTKITADKLHYKVGWTPYAGLRSVAPPEYTISRGEVVSAGGEIIGRVGRGKFLSRACS
ncbi:MAG: dihydroorotase [Candidatus Hadarchaeales archaeon]